MTIDPRLAERRKAVAEDRAKRNLWKLLKVLVALIAVASAVWIALSPLMSVSQVRSTGVVASDAHETMAAHSVVAGTPMILIRSGEVEEALESDPWISEARVHLNWPNEVVVRIVERTPVAWVRTTSGWARRAIDGVALPSPAGPKAGMPWIELPGVDDASAETSPMVLGAVEFAAAMTDEYGHPVIRAQGEELWATIAGFEVRLGRPVEMSEKARSLGALLKESIPEGSTLILIAPGHPAVSTPPRSDSGEPEETAPEGS